jgi:hypothetical protein
MSKAGILKFIINFYKTKNDKNKTKWQTL